MLPLTALPAMRNAFTYSTSGDINVALNLFMQFNACVFNFSLAGCVALGMEM